MLNSLYGKFGSKIESTKKIVSLNDGINKFTDDDPEIVKPNYVALAVFITSISRFNIISDAQANYANFIYADTDSLHLIKSENPVDLDIDPSEFGKWKLEGNFIRGKYLRAKLYVEMGKDGKMFVKGAGMTNDIKSQITFDNFKFGESFKGKRASKQVKGGMIIYNTEFTIREGGFLN